MALKDMKSRFDRHTIQDPAVPPAELSGQTVGGPGGVLGPRPGAGDYFTAKGNTDSPFDTVREPRMDQMVQMLKGEITSNNHGYPRGPGTMTYGPAPGGSENSPFQDLDGIRPNGYVNPATKTTY